MAIKIQTKKPEIPIEIGDLKFSFDVTDESIKKFREKAVEIQKEFHSIGKTDDDNVALEKVKDVLKRGFDLMLGKGTFEKIYDLSPSIMICMDYFVQIVEGIEQELQNRRYTDTPKENVEKYLKKVK